MTIRRGDGSAPAGTLSELVRGLGSSHPEAEHVVLGDLLEEAGHRSFGPVILMLGVVSVSPLTLVPGGNWLVAAVTLVFSVQILLGRSSPWLPPGLEAARFPRRLVEATKASAAPLAHALDRMTAPRLTFLTDPPFIRVVALLAAVTAAITFPLSLFPLGPVLPGAAIILLGIGLTARDGVWLGLSMLALAGSVGLFVQVLQVLA